MCGRVAAAVPAHLGQLLLQAAGQLLHLPRRCLRHLGHTLRDIVRRALHTEELFDTVAFKWRYYGRQAGTPLLEDIALQETASPQIVVATTLHSNTQLSWADGSRG